MDLAGGYCGSAPVFVWVTLAECLWNTYWLLITVPSLTRENPQLMALFWCQRNTENTQKRTQPQCFMGGIRKYTSKLRGIIHRLFSIISAQLGCVPQPHSLLQAALLSLLLWQPAIPNACATFFWKNTRPRATNNMYLISYALFQLKKKEKNIAPEKK